jgi:predicted nucleotidyltransferase
MNFEYPDHIVYEIVAGSHLYGTNGPDSDIDRRGIIIPPYTYFIGLDRFEQWEGLDNDDACFYDIRKFFNLAMAGNPNVLEILWAKDPYYNSPDMREHKIENMILETRELLISRAIIKPHLGMAIAHLKRLDYPNRKCGSKGKALISKFGYNTKDAACVIRILEQCYELLTERKITFPRNDAAFLRAVRDGEYKLEYIKELAQTGIDQIRELEIKLIGSSKVPKAPKRNRISERVAAIIYQHLKTTGEL